MAGSLSWVIPFLIENGQQWTRSSRKQHRPNGRQLVPDEISYLSPFFHRAILDAVRVDQVPLIQNPWFYDDFREKNIPIPLDFTQMAGITFDDTIVISSARSVGASWPSLLFHELVHVVQFSILGVDEFVVRYVKGWANYGLVYETIPMEADARALEQRFAVSPADPFDVRMEVQRRLDNAPPAA